MKKKNRRLMRVYSSICFHAAELLAEIEIGEDDIARQLIECINELLWLRDIFEKKGRNICKKNR
jgi:hypothetical protein